MLKRVPKSTLPLTVLIPYKKLSQQNPKIYFFASSPKKKYMNVALIYNIFSVTIYLHIYLWKHVVWVDERKDEYIRVFMNTASIYMFTFEFK